MISWAKTVRQPLISVCIPVFETEDYLESCLRSAWMQDFFDFEIIVVSDASHGRDQKGRSAKKIVKASQKESDRWRIQKALPPILIRFIEHKENRGLIEVRRTLMFNAHGFYITQLDSDDELETGALKALYSAAKISSNPKNSSGEKDGFQTWQIDRLQILQNPQSFFDIVHGTSRSGTFDETGNFIPTAVNRYGKIFYGTITSREIFRCWLIEGSFTANTWGKLIKRELYLAAYENIPYTECNMADDILLFFFLSQKAMSYKGIEEKVYRYRVNTGMSSSRKIDTLGKWRMICSTASVFSIISQWIESAGSEYSEDIEDIKARDGEGANNSFFLREDEVRFIRQMTSSYLANNLKQMKETVIPELQEEARKMLCDYWGEGFVKKIESLNGNVNEV